MDIPKSWFRACFLIILLDLELFSILSRQCKLQNICPCEPECVRLFVCLFGDLLPTREFSHIWTRHNYRWRAANFDLFNWHWWPLSSEGSLTGHTYCDTGRPLYNGHLRGPVTLTPVAECWQWSCHYMFWRLRSVSTGDLTSISCMRDGLSTTTPPRSGMCTFMT